MTVTSANVSEGAGSVSLNVSLVTPNGAALGCPVTVSYATSSGAAIEGSDLPHTTGLVTFAAGTASGATRAIAIPITNDAAHEADETFSVGLFGASGAAISISSTVVVTIVNDDPPVVQFATAASTASEGAGSAALTVTLTAGAPLAAAASVDYATANGTAVAGQDYTAVSGTLSFAAGSTNGATRTIAVPILLGAVHEGRETLTVTLSAPSGATMGAPSAHTLTIADDDPVPDPVVVVELPADGTIGGSHVTISGYAIDRHASSGTGITAVNVYAYPNADLSQPPIFLGTAAYGAWAPSPPPPPAASSSRPAFRSPRRVEFGAQADIRKPGSISYVFAVKDPSPKVRALLATGTSAIPERELLEPLASVVGSDDSRLFVTTRQAIQSKELYPLKTTSGARATVRMNLDRDARVVNNLQVIFE